jgi:GNAT superfamily N-acetyltransferase
METDVTTGKIRLRKVRDGDADDLAMAWRDQSEVYAALDPDLFVVPDVEGLGPWLVEGLASQADRDRRLVLVADIDGQAAGFLVAAVIPPHAAADRQSQRDLARARVQIEALAVQRAYWRRGVGSRLLRAAEDWARNRGALTISAQAFVRGPAHEFLNEQGYAPQATVFGKRLTGAAEPHPGNRP